MIENSLYLACCQTATAIAADHLVSHRLHAQSAIEKMDSLTKIPAHVAENIASLKADFQHEEARLSKALQTRLAELLTAQGLDCVR